jgi:dipeptide/tripeptide permease
MVAMGSSLADRAWGRDSAVFRITGVLSVIGGWFLTAGAAFTICFFVALIIGLAAFTLIRSQVLFKKKNLKGKENETFKEIMRSTDSNQALNLMRVLTREELNKVLLYAEENFDRTVNSFINENLRGLRKAMGASKF